jgi:hypothetical protein
MDRARSIPAEIESFLAGYNAQVRAITLSLRDLVLGVAPGAMEQIDMAARLLAYGFARTYKDTICVIMPLKAGVNLGFPRGTDLPDPAGLLIGTGKRARHVRLSSVEQVEAPAVRALLEAALALWRGRA